MSILYILIKFFRLLNKNTSDLYLSLGFILGLFIAFTPKNIFVDVVLGSFVFVFSLPITAVFFGVILGPLFFPIVDPIFLFIGKYMLLELTFLNLFWEYFFELPLIAFFSFNNTLMLGSIIGSAFLSFPLHRLFCFLLKRYGAILRSFSYKIKSGLSKAERFFKR